MARAGFRIRLHRGVFPGRTGRDCRRHGPADHRAGPANPGDNAHLRALPRHQSRRRPPPLGRPDLRPPGTTPPPATRLWAVTPQPAQVPCVTPSEGGCGWTDRRRTPAAATRAGRHSSCTSRRTPARRRTEGGPRGAGAAAHVRRVDQQGPGGDAAYLQRIPCWVPFPRGDPSTRRFQRDPFPKGAIWERVGYCAILRDWHGTGRGRNSIHLPGRF